MKFVELISKLGQINQSLHLHNQCRRFQSFWFELYLSWFEFSKKQDAIYCLSCYIFCKSSLGCLGSNSFIENTLKNWKKVNSGADCPILYLTQHEKITKKINIT